MKLNPKVKRILNDHGYSDEYLQERIRYDYSDFGTDREIWDEECPGCGTEIEVTTDGLTTCPECGKKNVLPCSACPRVDLQCCDWSGSGCLFFNYAELKKKEDLFVQVKKLKAQKR